MKTPSFTMDQYLWRIIAKSREIRNNQLSNTARCSITIGITANHLTLLSLICGILAAYFFLVNWWWLALFSLLHLLFDSLDGVVARLTAESAAGKYLDLASDSIPVILILIKIGWQFEEYMSYLAAGLFTFSLLFFFLSRLKTVFIPLRLFTLLAAVISTLPFFNSPLLPIITFTYLACGICSAYALARQLQWLVTEK